MGVRSEAKRLVNFTAVGTVAFLVDFGIFNLLRAEDSALGPIWAKVVSVTLATTVSWIGSRYWTFRDGRRSAAVPEVVGFFAVNALGMLLALACLWVSHYLLGLRSALADNISGNVVGVILGNVFRYFAYRTVIYRIPLRKKPAPPRREVIDSWSAGQE